MHTRFRVSLAAFAAAFALSMAGAAAAQAQLPSGSEAQRQAMQTLSWMDGEWVGEAKVSMGPGRTSTLPHTERIGPMLGGSIRVIEGRSVNPDGSAAFNAFAVVSWDDTNERYMMRSYANGQAGDFPLEASAEGFSWAVPAPGGEMRFVTTFRGGEWLEVGDFVMPGRDPMRVIELRLRRRGDTGWPAAGAIVP